jgi:hypothetical protein
MHPGSKDYTQGVFAWSILLDDERRELVEEFSERVASQSNLNAKDD